MPKLCFPYGKGFLSAEIPDEVYQGEMTSQLHHFRPAEAPEELLRQALLAPVSSPPLKELARGKNKVVIIASDHTRPVPSRLIIPPMLREIREGNPQADITLLIATGCHRGMAKQELVDKFGEKIVREEKIVIHDCDDAANLVNIGTLPSGGECLINRLALEADLLTAEGFIEPHFFAGFSGGRKSVLPGIAGRNTVLSNHCSEFIAHPNARTGVLEGNPIHRDMLWAAEKAKLAFIVNVVLNGSKEVIYAVAGDPVAAHRKGCDFLSSLCRAKAIPADIVISTNGGYPLDQNIYQAVKGMTAAEAAVKEGGVIIMAAHSGDGTGGEAFYRQLADEPDIEKTRQLFMSRSRNETEPDQWQSQILIRILQKARVIYVSEAPEETVCGFHMLPARTLSDALRLARELLNKPDASVSVIPDGVSVIVAP